MTGGPVTSVDAGDITGDGRREIFVVTVDAAYVAHLRIYDADGTTLDSRNLGPWRNSFFSVNVIDVNGDTKNDVLLTRGDHFMHLADLTSYAEAQQRVGVLYEDAGDGWAVVRRTTSDG